MISFNILLRPLQKNTKETGLCLLIDTNCIGYEQVYGIMLTDLHLKLTREDYFKLFLNAMACVKAADNNSGGFKLLYHIVESIHPQLLASKGEVHKVIESPSYDNVEDYSIYTFITRYKNYLLYKKAQPRETVL